MDLVLLAERPQKISILTTCHLKVKQHGHSLRRRANARNYKSSRWPIYIINSVDKTKYLVILPHRRSTTVSLKTYPLLWHLNWLKINLFLFCLSIYLVINLLISFIQNRILP